MRPRPPQSDGQGELFPYLSIETIEDRLEHCRRRLRPLSPQLTTDDFWAVLGELALLEHKLDQLESRRRMMDRFGAILSPAPSSPATSPPTWATAAAAQLPASTWRRRARRSPTCSTTSSIAAPSAGSPPLE